MSINIEEINQNDFKNICRTCLINCDAKFSLDYVISDIFYKLTDIRFETNELPQQICRNCFQKINYIHAFSLQIKEIHSSLMKCLTYFKNTKLNEETHDSMTKNEEISIEEHKIEVDLISCNNDVKKLPENQQNINCSDNNLLKPIDPNDVKNENLNLIDLCENSSDSAENKIICDQKYICDICNYKFKFLGSLLRHRNIHGINPYKCKLCIKSFKVPQKLKDHMLTHVGERLYKCEQCSNVYKQQETLDKHLRVHRGERPPTHKRKYKCKYCPKIISGKLMMAHLRTHGGERVFECNKCALTFNQSTYLDLHMRTHVTDRPNKCDHCATYFKRLDKLEEHMRVHTGEVSYKCKECSMSFGRPSLLEDHMRLHSSGRPFKCRHCDRTFKQSKYLQVHLRTHRGVSTDVSTVQKRSVDYDDV